MHEKGAHVQEMSRLSVLVSRFETKPYREALRFCIKDPKSISVLAM
jgi:hypothetical protein